MDYDYIEIYNKTKDLIVDYLRVDESEITPNTDLAEDLCVDSIALAELGFRISEAFSIPMLDPKPEMLVMQNLVSLIMDNMKNGVSQ
ncbi:MAG TPA: phosphopantetheine-binding protein, partial [Acetivibrio sp.]|nr:phosphopantetheine-binding protein [Acetivibrio sp.]